MERKKTRLNESEMKVMPDRVIFKKGMRDSDHAPD